VRVRRTAEFDLERANYALRFCCEECAHFDAASDRCRHGWPAELHRQAHYDTEALEIVFCKEFDLC
jgi:hypothetical protein